MSDFPSQPESSAPTPSHRRFGGRKLGHLAWVAGAVATAMVGLSVTGTISGFTASITNTQNTTGSGTLIMQETNNAGTVSCYSNGATANATIGTNANNCATINKFGGDVTPDTAGLNLVPGAAGNTTIVKIKNAGSISATTFTLAPSTCTQSNNTGNSVVAGVGAYGTATDLCTKVNVVIKQGATTVFSGTAAQLASGTGATTPLVANLGPVAAGSLVSMTFVVSLDTTAGNTYQGLALNLPMTWNFSQ